MPDGLIGIDAFRAAVRAKRKPEGGVFHVLSGEPKAYDDGSRRVRFVFSDGSVDRMGDTIAADGWDLADFKRNPVALWAHDSSEPPIGKASNVKVEGKNVCRALDIMLHNNKNTPPFPLIQPPIIVVVP